MKKNDFKALYFYLSLFMPWVAEADQVYLNKFLTYQHYSQNLPKTTDSAFDAFITPNTPLTHKLREKWLYQLAWNKDWSKYTQYYRPSQDINLQCYAQTALYHQGQQQQVIAGIKPLWLSGGSQAKACDGLFNILLAAHAIDDSLIAARIQLALDAQNVALARYLLKQYHPPLNNEAELITRIHQQPTYITQLPPSSLHSKFYLYGLNSMVSHRLNHALGLWAHPKSRQMLNETQQQSFIAHVALYKAMRQEPDTAEWFDKIKAPFYNDRLLDWQMRHSIAEHRWPKLIELIQHMSQQDEPVWQYWLARAFDATGKTDLALPIYQTLAQKRNYYGFLASLKLNQAPQFTNEEPTQNIQILAIYKPILDQIQELYTHKQALAASRLLNDFSLELPKEEKSALAYWVEHQLKWYGKSVYMSNNDELSNQLSLRFPLAHQNLIDHFAHQYQISPILVYAMIRQESAFRDDIVSPAGANGLMQIMPNTAKLVAKHANIPYRDAKDLYLTEKNIQIGIAYLQQLAKQYHMHPLLMAAAYNAGPRQVNYWLKHQATADVAAWIESLPWLETRNYLKNVMAFYLVYQYRLGQTPDINPFLHPFDARA